MAGRPKRRARLARQKRERARRTRSNPNDFRGSPNDTFSQLYNKNKDNDAAMNAIVEAIPEGTSLEEEYPVGVDKLREIKNALKRSQRSDEKTSGILDDGSPYDKYGSRESSSAAQSQQEARMGVKKFFGKTDLPQNIRAAIMSNDLYSVLTQRQAASQGVQPHDVLSTVRALFQLQAMEDDSVPELDLDFDFGLNELD